MRHHPDVAQSQEKTTTGSGGDSSHSSMVDINTAYKTVNQFHKTGGRLSGQQSQQKTQWHQRRQDYSQTNHAQRPYEPLYEDVDPLFYEMLWEEMRRQNEKEEFNHSTFGGDFYKHGESPNPMHEEFYGYDPFNNEFFRPGGKPPPRKKNPNQNNNQQTRSQNKNQNNNNNTKQKTTTWPATDLQALVNMYQDGKSFEFIANAFNKKRPR
ncbi:hypothetical protein ADEAN_000800200 [Angomonas deanei]|uniref:Uncharacterized protein n=1 Tax=Angomonas deanei TaxID=59799 RepID=A0A7G2CKT7_9TRYP|nr:hypothetical protein ADEAN_000800200 [Angomonas deanei]